VELEKNLENMIHMLFICDTCIECIRIAEVEPTVSLTYTFLSAQRQHVSQFFTMYPPHQMNI
jgi:hypothetical protein